MSGGRPPIEAGLPDGQWVRHGLTWRWENDSALFQPPPRAIPTRSIPASAACGTESGYTAHRRRGEDACGPCRAARRHGERRRVQQRRARARTEAAA